MMQGVKLNHWFFWSLLAVCVLTASLAYSQVVPTASVPKMVGTISGAGFVPLYETAATDSYLPWLIQVDCVTDIEFTFWGYGFGALGTDWGILSPEYGVTAADTSLTLLAGESEVYTFAGRVRPAGMYVKAGTGKIKGE